MKKIKISWKVLTYRLRISVGPRTVNIKKKKNRYSIVKLVKTKDQKKNLKNCQRKKAHYIPENMIILSGFSSEKLISEMAG